MELNSTSEILKLIIVLVSSFFFLYYSIFQCDSLSTRCFFLICFLGFFIFGSIRYYEWYTDLSSCQYEITVNEKTFKTSDIKTKLDGSIEFTADDGTIIRASEYEIRKLSGSNDISEGENK